MHGWGRAAARWSGFAVAYAAALALSVAVRVGPAPLLAVNLAVGVAAAVALALVRTGRPLRAIAPYLAVAAGVSVVVRTAGGLAAPDAALLAAGNAVEVLVLVVLVRAWTAAPGQSRARRAVLFLVAAALAAAAGSLTAVPALAASAGPDDLASSFSVVFWCRVAGHLVGVLVAGSFVVGGGRLRQARPREWAELGGWLLLLALTGTVGLGAPLSADPVRPYLPLAVLLVAVLRLGSATTAVLLPALVLGTVAATAAGGTVFAAAGRDAVQTVADVQLYCVVATVAAWCAAAVTDDRADAVEELRTESASLTDRVEQQRLALAHVEELTAHLGEARGLEQVLDRLMPRLARIVGADTVRVLLLDPDDKTLVGGGSLGLDEEVRDGTRIPVGEGFAGTVAATGTPWVVDDLRTVDVRSPVLRVSGVRSLAAVPLLAGGEVVGVLHVGARRTGAFSAPGEDPVPWLARVAEPIAAAVARDRLAADLARADARGRAALDELLDPVTLCRPVPGEDGPATDFTVVYANHAARAWGSRVGVALAEPLTRSGLGDLLDGYRRAFTQRDAVLLDAFRLPPAAGTSTERFLDLRLVRRGDELLVTWRDVTARRLAEQALADSEQRFRMAFDDAPVGMAVASLEPGRVGQYVEVNEAFAGITGRPRAWHVGRTFRDLDHPDEQAEDAAQAAELATGERRVYHREKRILRPDGTTVWVRMTASAVRRDGVPVYVVGHAEDVTERRQAQDELARRALHDGLTGLANRHLLMDHLRLALRDLDRRPGTLALLLLDLDKFKDVNDSLGHAAGDEVIREVGHRLDGAVRGPDTAARLAGDEFVVVARVRDDVDAVRLAERLVAVIGRPLTVRGRRLEILPSVGVTTTDDAFADPDALLREADLAMYQAKRSGRRPWELYDEGLHARALERLAVTEELREALSQNRFRLLYQPVVDLRSGRVVGAEALLRLEHPERGLLAPAEFIDVAEDSDLIVPLGGWVLEEACRRLADWHADPATAHLHVAVNVSGRQAGHGVVREQVRRATAAAGVDPRHVVLEITERVLAEAPGVVEDLVSATDLGCRIAIDDFGTGWSSLAYLKRFPVSTVKIDRSFIEGLGRHGDDTAIVEAVTALARTLDLTSVAEGVETPSQLAELRRLGCHRAQGFHFGRPMPADDLAVLAGARRR